MWQSKIPVHRISEFEEYLKTLGDNPDIDAAVSDFLYGKKGKKEDIVEPEKEVIRSEIDVFMDVVSDKFSQVDFSNIRELVWTVAYDRNRGREMYLVEVIERTGRDYKVVIADKDKSIRFLGFLDKLSNDAKSIGSAMTPNEG